MGGAGQCPGTGTAQPLHRVAGLDPVLDPLRLIRHHRVPMPSGEFRAPGVLAQDAVAGQGDVGAGPPLPQAIRGRTPDDDRGEFRRPLRQLPAPLIEDAGRGDHQNRTQFPARLANPQRRDGLDRLAEAHVVRKKNPVHVEQDAHAFPLERHQRRRPGERAKVGFRRGAAFGPGRTEDPSQATRQVRRVARRRVRESKRERDGKPRQLRGRAYDAIVERGVHRQGNAVEHFLLRDLEFAQRRFRCGGPWVRPGRRMSGAADDSGTAKQPHRNLECCRAWAVQFVGNGDEQCQAAASLEQGTHDIPLLVAGVARLTSGRDSELQGLAVDTRLEQRGPTAASARRLDMQPTYRRWHPLLPSGDRSGRTEIDNGVDAEPEAGDLRLRTHRLAVFRLASVTVRRGPGFRGRDSLRSRANTPRTRWPAVLPAPTGSDPRH